MLRILLAEDTPAQRRLVTQALSGRGHEVHEAWDGEQAVAAWSARPSGFDVVLMDIHMPIMDGIEAAKSIRATNEGQGKRATIIAVTSHVDPDDPLWYQNAGMDAWVPKPIDLAELVATVERMGHFFEEDPTDEVDVSEAILPLPFQRAVAVKRLGGQEDLFDEMAQFFLEDAPGLLKRTADGLASGDPEGARRASHSLAGLAATLEACDVVQAARAVESALRTGDVNRASAALPRLFSESERLERALVLATG